MPPPGAPREEPEGAFGSAEAASGVAIAEAGDDELPPNLPAVIDELEEEGLDAPTATKAVKIVARAYSRIHSGPLPRAEEFARYDAVCPGAAREILQMAVRAQTHGHDMDRTALKSEVLYRNIAISAAALIILAMIAGSVICAIFGRENAAIALGTAAGLSSLAGVFIRGRNLFGSGQESKAKEAPEPQPEEAPPPKPSQRKLTQRKRPPGTSRRKRN